MILKKTVDDGVYLRIENEEGSAITIRRGDDIGHILSISVQKEEREKRIGSALVMVAEWELSRSGIWCLEADYAEGSGEWTGFFEKNGFRVMPGAEVLSLPMASLMESGVVKKALAEKKTGTRFLQLSSLPLLLWDELIDKVKKSHACISDPDVARLEQDISGVVYDEKKTLRAAIFCSKSGSGLHVDFLLGFGANPQRYVITAIVEMLYRLEETGGTDRYDRLTVIATTSAIGELMEHAMGEMGKPDKVGETMHARKKIQSHDGRKLHIADAFDEGMEEAWRREIRKIPLQANISYKLPWSRRVKGETGKEKEGTPQRMSPDRKDRKDRGGETERITRTEIFTLTENAADKMGDELPDYVRKRIGKPNIFALGAVIEELGQEILAGVCQFMIKEIPGQEPVAELSYVYVYELYRREGVGLALLDKMTSILKKSGVGKCLAILPRNAGEKLGYGCSEKELSAFLWEGGCLSSEEASDLWMIVERGLFAGAPDILMKNTRRYIKRIR